MADILYGEQLSEVATSATSPQVAKTISPTVVTGGDFHVLMTYEVNLNVANLTDIVHISGIVDGIEIGFHSYVAEATADWHPGTFHTKATLAAGARTLQVQFNVNNAVRTGKVRNIRLFAWSVAIEAADVNHSGSNADPTALPFLMGVQLPVVTGPATYLAIWSALLSNSTAGARTRLAGGIYVGAGYFADPGGGEVRVQAAGYYEPVAGMRYFTVDSGGQVVSLSFGITPSAGEAFALHGCVVVLRIDAAGDLTVVAFNETAGEQSIISGSLTPVAAASGTAIATPHLMLAGVAIRHSLAAGTMQYDVRHAGTGLQGTGQILAADVNQRLAFLALNYAAYTAGPFTDDLRVAGGGTAPMVAKGAAVLVLKVGLQVNSTDPVTIQEAIQVAFTKVLDAETLTLSDALQIVYALDAATTTQGISLADVLEILQQREFTDSAALTDSLLALMLPPPVVQGFYGPVQLVEIFPPSGVRRYATGDIYVTHPDGLWPPSTLFKGLQIQTAPIGEGDIDQLLGFQALEDAQFSFGNLTGEFTYMRAEDVRGAVIRSFAWDPVTGEMRRTFVGIIRQPAIGFQATIAATMQSLALLEKEFPGEKITATEFPRADPSAIDKPITVCWGSWRKLPCRLIDANPNLTPPPSGSWVYLAYKKALAVPERGFLGDVSLPRVTFVYRAGRLVNATEYAVHYTDGPYAEKFVTVEFFHPQDDLPICCDLVQDDPTFRHPVTIAAGVLAVYGGETINAGSADACAAALNEAYPDGQLLFDFAAYEVEQFQVVLDRLLFRIRLGRDDDAKWTFTAVMPATRAALRIGYGDGELENIIDLTPLEQRALEDLPSSFELEYAYTSGFFDDDQGYVLKRSMVGSAVPNAQPRPMQNKYIRDHATADKVLQYIVRRWLANGEQGSVTLGLEARNLERGELVLMSVPLPSYAMANEPREVVTVTRERHRITPRLARYSSDIFVFARNVAGDPADPAEPAGALTPDYRYTPPPAPRGLNLEAGAATATPISINNGGDSLLGTILVGAAATPGLYRLRITVAAVNAGTFQLLDEQGTVLGTGTVGTSTTLAGLTFTLADRAPDWTVGEGFDIRVAAAWIARRATGVGGDGRIVVTAPLRVRLPAAPKNGDFVIVKWQLAGSDTFLSGSNGWQMLIAPSNWGTDPGVYVAIPNFIPGMAFDFQASIRNSKNFRNEEVNLQDGDVLALTNVLVPEGLVPTLDVAGWTVEAVGTIAAIAVRVLSPTHGQYPPVVAAVRLYRRADTQTPTEADFVAQQAGMSDYLDLGVGSDPAVAWYYWAKLVDSQGVPSDQFTPMSAAVHVRQLSPGQVGQTLVTQSARDLVSFGLIATGTFVPLGQLAIEIQPSGPAQLAADLRIEGTFLAQFFNGAGAVVAGDQLEARILVNGVERYAPRVVMTGYTGTTGILLIPLSTVITGVTGTATVVLEVKATMATAVALAGKTSIDLVATYQGQGATAQA